LILFQKFKRVEAEYSEVKSALDYLQNEMASLKDVTAGTEARTRNLKSLMEVISKKQSQLERALDSNSRCLDTDLKFNIYQVRSVSERLLELISAFGNDGLNKTRVDMTFQASGSQLTTGLANVYAQFKAKFLGAEEQNRAESEVFSAENRAVFKRLFTYSEFRDQKGLFDQFVRASKEIQSRLNELAKMGRGQNRYAETRSLAGDLAGSLEACKVADASELTKYSEVLVQDAKKIRDLKPEIAEVGCLF